MKTHIAAAAQQTIVPSEHEKREWSRMAGAAYRAGRNDIGHTMSVAAATCGIGQAIAHLLAALVELVAAFEGVVGGIHPSRVRQWRAAPVKPRTNMKYTSQIILPNIQSMMTGVWRIQRAHDLVTLEYTDNTREAARIPLAQWARIQDNVFAIVSAVQAQRVRG